MSNGRPSRAPDLTWPDLTLTCAARKASAHAYAPSADGVGHGGGDAGGDGGGGCCRLSAVTMGIAEGLAAAITGEFGPQLAGPGDEGIGGDEEEDAPPHEPPPPCEDEPVARPEAVKLEAAK